MHSKYASIERRKQLQGALFIGALFLWGLPAGSRADLLVADRLSHAVYRYSDSGALLGTVVNTSLFQWGAPTGIAISPDATKLYLSSSVFNRVWRFNYEAATGVAGSPTIFADGNDGLDFPNDIQFSPDGDTIYVANLNGGVSRFNIDGSSAGGKLMLPTPDEEIPTPATSINFMSDGRLLVGAFQDPSGEGGGIAISNPAISAIPDFLVEPRTEIRGATGLMIHDGYLYVSGLHSHSIRRFSLPGGQIDSSWVIDDEDVAYPQDLAVAPDGNGFLAGILGDSEHPAKINRYSFDLTQSSTFALPSQNGFDEPTAFVFVPTPTPTLTGDFNKDGVVDAADYVMWRKTSPNDPSGYSDWLENFGESDPSGSGGLGAHLVPEPGCVMLLFLTILASSTIRRRS